MGDHHIGREMGLKAELALARRKDSDRAIDLLDRICNPHKGRDAEFESEDPDSPGCVHPEYDRYTEPHPKAALGMLMLEAFAPEGLNSLDRYSGMRSDNPDEDEVATDRWWEEVYEPFCARYRFC